MLVDFFIDPFELFFNKLLPGQEGDIPPATPSAADESKAGRRLT